jgi:aminopeptidase N
MKKIGIFVLYLLAAIPSFSQQALPPQKEVVQNGVSETLARHRAKTLGTIRYALDFNIPDQVNESIKASEVLTFVLGDRSAPLQIDFKETAAHIQQVTVNERIVPVRYENEHIIIQQQYLRKGSNTIAIRFIAGDLSLNRNNDFLYTLLVPDRARTLFPCFDQPDLKAVFTLTMTVPDDWKVVSDASVKDSVNNGQGRKTVRFQASDKISTYLFSFVAGKFYCTAKQADGRTMNFYYRETDSAKLRSSVDPVFSIQADAIRFMEEYTAIQFPFAKFDCVAIPDFQFGGMEHVGAIQYRAATLFLDTSATKDQLNARSNVLTHETAHMWFGDLVTMRWFNDVWMKEVFANFMADKIGNITLKDNNYDLKFLTDHYPAAYDIDRTAGANPIRQPLENLQDAGSLYGNIIYHKAPIMMRQLEKLMGEKPFRKGIREYLKKYAYGNASWPELISILDAYTSEDLQAWNRIWVNETGRPQFTYQLKTDDGRIKSLSIHQRGELDSNRTWPQYFKIALVYPDSIEEVPVNMNRQDIHMLSVVGRKAPLFLLFNSLGEGYGIFPVDVQSLTYLSALKSPLMRASAYINLYENMLSGRAVTPSGLLDFDEQAILKETDELTMNVLLDQITTVFWHFTPARKWNSLAPALENVLWQAMQNAKTPNLKKQLFKTFGGIGLSKKAQDTVFAVWKKRQPPEGISLSEDDYTGLATMLAIRNYPGYEGILRNQLDSIKDPDRRKRLAYLMPALSNEVNRRDSFFLSLQDHRNRVRESWVLTALSYLHHPLRTDVSEKYLPKSLELLEEIQLTGGIFFPQSWLGVTLGWYQTPSAATTIHQFLDEHPHYNPGLKKKILQSADDVFRAVRFDR